MITVNNFTAWVSVSNSPLQEYDIQVTPETNTVVCWIASEAGKSYALNWRDDWFRTTTAGYARIDGVECGGMVITNPMGTRTCRLEGIRATATTLKPFTFATVKVTDDTDFLSTPDTPEMGEIKITIRTVQVNGYMELRPIAAPAAKTFHETAKKGLNHQTEHRSKLNIVGAWTRRHMVRRKPSFSLNIDHLVILFYCGKSDTFSSRVLSQAMLQATGVAPLPLPQRVSPDPPRLSSISHTANASASSSSRKRRAPPSSDTEDVKPNICISLTDDDDDGSDEESQELHNRMNAIRAKKIKLEKKPKVKSEKVVHLGTIDLTLDDD
uniref:DUF7918 domain-containing protein n=1 Tax=Moniliophthora roreri TaxID=221103 RepID=A0A0W0G7R8_MONRR